MWIFVGLGRTPKRPSPPPLVSSPFLFHLFLSLAPPCSNANPNSSGTWAAHVRGVETAHTGVETWSEKAQKVLDSWKIVHQRLLNPTRSSSLAAIRNSIESLFVSNNNIYIYISDQLLMKSCNALQRPVTPAPSGACTGYLGICRILG